MAPNFLSLMRRLAALEHIAPPDSPCPHGVIIYHPEHGETPADALRRVFPEGDAPAGLILLPHNGREEPKQ